MLKLLSIIMSLNMLVASTGIPVYTHLCKESNKQSVSVMEMNCAEELEGKSCCGPDTCHDRSTESLEDCCETDGDWYRPDITATSELKKSTFAPLPVMDVPVLTLSVDMRSGNDVPTISVLQHRYPPNTGVAVQAALQVFRC